MPQRYDNFADWYDTYVTSGIGQPFARSADRLLAQILGPGDDRLCLDLGCGGGAHTPTLTGLGWRVIGIDISARQIDITRRTGLPAVVGSAGRLPLADESVDAVATIMTTTDFDDLRPVLAEARRVLRPGGRLPAVAPAPPLPPIRPPPACAPLRPVPAGPRRVLRPGGRLAVVAAHPCFGGV